MNATELLAVQWFSAGDETRNHALPTDMDQYNRNTKRLRIARELAELEQEKSAYVAVVLGPPGEKDAMERRLGVHIERIVDTLTQRIDERKRDLSAEYGR